MKKLVDTQLPSANKPSSKPRYDIDGRYQALLDAGESLLCSGGYEQAQPKYVAGAAGVSVGLFYKHFSGKRELLTAVMVRRLEDLHQKIETAILEQMSSEDALKLLIIETLTYFHQHEGLISLFFMEIGYGDTKSTQQMKIARKNYRRLLRSVLIRGIQQEEFVKLTPTELELTISSIVGTVNWTLYEVLVVKEENIDPLSLRDSLMALFLRGLRL